MTTKISLTQAIDLVEMAIAEKGEDYVYERPFFPDMYGTHCAYFDANGKPSCIVGWVFHRLGYKPHGTLNFTNIERLATAYDSTCGLELDSITRRYLLALQSAQDGGTPWGEANRRAMILVETYRKRLANEETSKESVNA